MAVIDMGSPRGTFAGNVLPIHHTSQALCSVLGVKWSDCEGSHSPPSDAAYNVCFVFPPQSCLLAWCITRYL